MASIPANGVASSRSADAVAGSDMLFSQPGGVNADASTMQLASLPPEDNADGNPQPAADLSSQPSAEDARQDEVVTASATDEARVDQPKPGATLTDAPSAPPAEQISLVETNVPTIPQPEPDQASMASANPLDIASLQPADLVVQLGLSLKDLGHDNGEVATQAILNLPGEVTGLNSSSGNVADIIHKVGWAIEGAGNVINSLPDTIARIPEQSLPATLNEVVGTLHVGIEGISDVLGVGAHTLHGVTNLGETIGLGKLGQDNLLTDVIGLPETLSQGGNPIDAVGHIVGHVGEVGTAASNILLGVPQDLGSGDFGIGLLGPEGLLGGSRLDLAKLDDVLAQDGGGLGAVGGLVDNASNLLDDLGANSTGSLNLVTDALRLPGELLSGNGTPSLTDAGLQLDTTLTAAGDLVQNVLAGTSATNSPAGILGSLVGEVNGFGDTAGGPIGIPLSLAGLESTTSALGLGTSGVGDASHLATSLQQTVGGLLNDVSNDATLAGFGLGAGDDSIAVPSLGGQGADALVGSLVDPLVAPASVSDSPLPSPVGGLDDLLSPITGLLETEHHGQHGLGHALGLG